MAAGTTDLVNERISVLLLKDFRKFVKIFFFLKIRTDMRALDIKILQQRKANPAKVVESQIILSCKTL